MKNIIVTVFLLLLYWGTRSFTSAADTQALSTLLMGVMLLSAFLFASELKKSRLPRLTGYMVMGAVIGPFGLNFITHELMDQLHFLENLALAFIGITAGGELHFNRLKQNTRSIILILSFQLIIVFAGMFLLIYFLAPVIPGLSGLTPGLPP